MHVPGLSQLHHNFSLPSINNSNDTLSSLFQDINIDGPIRPLFLTILITFCLTIIILLTILGNILVLIALCIDFALRSPTHLLMGNLACADLLLGITVLPFSGTLEILHGNWLFGNKFCHIWLAIDVLYCTASIYGLMFISIERYIGVTRPLRYPIIVTHRRTMYAILLAWIVAALISLAPFLGWHNKINAMDHSCEVNDDLSYVFFSCSFSFYIPLIIILCVYGRIYGEANRQYQFLTGGQKKVHLNQTPGEEAVTLRIHLPKHMSSNGNHTQTSSNGNQITTTGSNKISRLRRERKAAKTLGIVVGMFILCWLPFFLLLPIKALTDVKPGAIFSICFWLGYCNSCFNPFIYAFSSREFRKAFKAILRCQRIQQYKPSTNSSGKSSRMSDHLRSKSSRETSSSLALRKSESTISRGTSNDSQRHNTSSSKTNRNITNDSKQILRHESITNQTIPKSLSASDNTSPWHRRKPENVR
ncbi:unnamed protein product [Adineta steineri]|uniref:G-protein coupled receptors family 1 profile domain-containing protein n=1 Tax=Adineta steineri TaxID=433720 RepID=A0A814EJ77_9BILA|nr:unnamed protein product [Adineta steineri]CAF3798329.1 unnamed protein product [Adineta steineri]